MLFSHGVSMLRSLPSTILYPKISLDESKSLYSLSIMQYQLFCNICIPSVITPWEHDHLHSDHTPIHPWQPVPPSSTPSHTPPPSPPP